MRRFFRRRWTRFVALIGVAVIGVTALVVVQAGTASASLDSRCDNYAHQRTHSKWHGNAFYNYYNQCLNTRRKVAPR
jgi:hypothetical protein